MMLFGLHNVFVSAIVGTGWGLMLDEIPPMLKMPSPGRKIELDVYSKTRSAVIVLIACVVLLSILLFLLFGHH